MLGSLSVYKTAEGEDDLVLKNAANQKTAASVDLIILDIEAFESNKEWINGIVHRNKLHGRLHGLEVLSLWIPEHFRRRGHIFNRVGSSCVIVNVNTTSKLKVDMSIFLALRFSPAMHFR